MVPSELGANSSPTRGFFFIGPPSHDGTATPVCPARAATLGTGVIAGQRTGGRQCRTIRLAYRRVPGSIQSIERAAAVLRLLGTAAGPLGLAEMARSLDLAKPTTHGILAHPAARRASSTRTAAPASTRSARAAAPRHAAIDAQRAAVAGDQLGRPAGRAHRGGGADRRPPRGRGAGRAPRVLPRRHRSGSTSASGCRRTPPRWARCCWRTSPAADRARCAAAALTRYTRRTLTVPVAARGRPRGDPPGRLRRGDRRAASPSEASDRRTDPRRRVASVVGAHRLWSGPGAGAARQAVGPVASHSTACGTRPPRSARRWSSCGVTGY